MNKYNWEVATTDRLIELLEQGDPASAMDSMINDTENLLKKVLNAQEHYLDIISNDPTIQSLYDFVERIINAEGLYEWVECPFNQGYTDNPTKDILSGKLSPSSVVVTGHEDIGDGPCIGWRYYENINSAIPSIIESAMLFDLVKHLEETAEEVDTNEFDYDGWKTILMKSYFLLHEASGNSDDIVAQLEELANYSSRHHLNIMTIEKYINIILNNDDWSIFNDATGDMPWDFDWECDEHRSWAANQLRACDHGV